jgi:hypothetical protein
LVYPARWYFFPYGDEQVDYVGRLPNGKFATGNPGRRRGSRNRASHRVVMSILEDFESHSRSSSCCAPTTGSSISTS